MTDWESHAELIVVQLPSGAPYHVLTEHEADFIEELSAGYLHSFQFEHASDLMDLDRIVYSEMLCWRWGLWLSRGHAYGPKGEPIALLPKNISEDLKRMSGEIRLMKKQLGIDYQTRKRSEGEDSVPYYLETLRQKALVFGIHRNHQADRAMELLNQAFGMATFWRNANDSERRMLHLTSDDIVEWLLDVAMPEYVELDRAFREGDQQFWVRDL